MAHGVLINGEALRLARLRKGWSARALAEECKKHQRPGGPKADFGNIRRYEAGSIRPLPATLLILANALGMDVADLLADESAQADASAA